MIDNSLLYEIIRNVTRIFAALMLAKYTLFLMVAPLHKVREAWRQLRLARVLKKRAYRPLVSVLVPAWNEEVGIVSTVRSLMEGSYDNLEVIVINDGSTDQTGQVIDDYLKSDEYVRRGRGKSVKYYYKDNGGKAKALNYGIEHARGEILVTVDADSIADKDMVGNIVKYFADDRVDAVVGNVKVAGAITFLNLLQRLEYLFGFYHKRAHSVLGAEYIYGGACAAFRRASVFDAIGVFETASITEDIEMSLGTRYHGLVSVYADDAICYTEGAGTIFGLVKQRVRWKKGRFEAFGKYRRMFFSTNYRHNKWLSWVILPFAMLSEVQLLFEPIGLTLLILYSCITGDFSSIILGALFIGMMYVVVGLCTERGRNWWIIPLLPFTWMIFYALVWVEYMALMKSLTATIRAEAVAWQKWQRKGIQVKQSSEERMAS